MSDETYNGWTNYPTWAVNLWLMNDQGSNDATLEIVADQYDDASSCLQVTGGPSYGEPIWTLEQARRFNTSAALREFVEEMTYLEEASMRSDLLGWALSSVNWDELAEGWIITLEEQRDYERASA